MLDFRKIIKKTGGFIGLSALLLVGCERTESKPREFKNWESIGGGIYYKELPNCKIWANTKSNFWTHEYTYIGDNCPKRREK